MFIIPGVYIYCIDLLFYEIDGNLSIIPLWNTLLRFFIGGKYPHSSYILGDYYVFTRKNRLFLLAADE